MAVKMFIARHGQNKDNLDGILNGHRDLPLTDLGRQQAQDLADGIEATGLTFDAVYSSPLDRAFETAKIICHTLGLNVEPVVIPELIERDFGVMTGVPSTEIEARCAPDILKTATITYFLNPEGAETFPDLIRRGHQALEHVCSLQQSGSALLVCHGDIGKMVYVAATGKPWEEVLRNFHFGNCDLIEVSTTEEAHKITLPQHNL
ncbi:MAG TPA: histidine phosphatase family protein [Candidatus Saccharimonadales bacterium]|nr:histidine phosphatase family protein [Candidatus Saccharimonadales bacterium]